MWAMLNREVVRAARLQFQDQGLNQFMSVSCVYYFRRDRILTKAGKAKRLDADNRLKILLDSVTQLVGFDDSLIWQGSFYKRLAASGIENCSVLLRSVETKDII